MIIDVLLVVKIVIQQNAIDKGLAKLVETERQESIVKSNITDITDKTNIDNRIVLMTEGMINCSSEKNECKDKNIMESSQTNNGGEFDNFGNEHFNKNDSYYDNYDKKVDFHDFENGAQPKPNDGTKYSSNEPNTNTTALNFNLDQKNTFEGMFMKNSYKKNSSRFLERMKAGSNMRNYYSNFLTNYPQDLEKGM